MKAVVERTDKVGDIVTQVPGADVVFKQYRIDFCCGGSKTLNEAIQQKNLNEAEIIQKLNETLQQAQTVKGKDTNWEKAPYSLLVDHIVNTHHAYLFDELPRLSAYVTKVYRVHGPKRPELADVYKLFHELKTEMEQHSIKEENDAFPLIKDYEQLPSESKRERLINVIEALEQEHDHSGDILKQLRDVTSDYKLPQGACNTFTLTYQKLEALEADLFKHIHLENNILFPRLLNDAV